MSLPENGSEGLNGGGAGGDPQVENLKIHSKDGAKFSVCEFCPLHGHLVSLPRLCRVAVFLIQTNVSLTSRDAPAIPLTIDLRTPELILQRRGVQARLPRQTL